ncbi:riboflavin synthase [Aridibaculum aurantiacum]|uniref:riboflavin synthase n=1 Tax=Aridibaculum aurantiacum TaxID=2810307 RepID=UPI001A957B4F|nr:riboflavin synthase [Aridibaculum aurantiacum]
MFTGIIEALGKVRKIEHTGTNTTYWIQSPISHELKVDQSVAHSGVCLTVEEIMGDRHRLTAIAETLEKTNLKQWKEGTLVNLERCLTMNGRLDGHIVQGHVDCTATCIEKLDKTGSWEFTFEFPVQFAALVIEKGSISLNGTSLTIFNVGHNQFTVAIIPYTYEHTSIGQVEVGTEVNLEFDMIGKYVARMNQLKQV